ncbi:MAG: PQQ-binding-like beta-propeller repeat protein, partial [Terriglobales bacterium]
MRIILAVALSAGALVAQTAGWPAYGGTVAGTRFSTARQITPANVNRLQPVWTYHTGVFQGLPPQIFDAIKSKAAFESTPILHASVLYLTTPLDQVIALDAASGRERWRYNPHLQHLGYSEMSSRGVAWWSDGGHATCSSRVVYGTLDARLIALDATTGQPCRDFGKDGTVDLTAGVDLRDPGNYQITSAPTVIGDRVVVGSSIGDNRAVSLERGVVRAFDVRTGKLAWTWDPIPWALRQKIRTGAANAW